MKPFVTMFVLLCLVLSFAASTFGQAVGDYRSAVPLPAGGSWNTPGSWERWNGSAWVVATAPPSGSIVITIVAGDSVYMTTSVSITGTVRNQGRLGPGSPTNLTIANGGTYEHAQDGGVIPTANWSTGSTCSVTGTVAVTSIAGGGNQNFYNLVWNCPAQTANTSIGAYGAVIGGNVTLVTSNTGRFYFMASNSGKTTIMGNMIIQGGNFGTNGTGSLTNDTVLCYGNLVVTGGNFAVSRGSQGGTGTTTWYQYGDVSLTSCTSQNSNPSGARLVFSKQGVQTLTLSNVTYGSGAGSPVNYDVASGTTLMMGTSDLGTAPNSSTGSFKVLDGARVYSGHASGLNGNITCTGAQGGGNSFSTAASYGFNGTVHQVTGSLVPTTVRTLRINNTANVSLSQSTAADTIYIDAGCLDKDGLALTGVVQPPGACITAVDPPEGTIPRTFFVDQNYPNPFNPTTTIRFGLPTKSHVAVTIYNLLGQAVARLFDGTKEAGVHSLRLDGAQLSSGLYFYRVQTDNGLDTKRMILMK